MNKKAMSSALLGILSIQNLLGNTAHAASLSGSQFKNNISQNDNASINSVDRILQKRIVGFDPKQAIETLSYLHSSGIQRFEKDGSLNLPVDLIEDLMATASSDGIEVRILGVNNNTMKVKFAAYDIGRFDRDRIDEAKELANIFQLKCDMDGKFIF